VVAEGWNKHDQCDVNDWRDIVVVSAGRRTERRETRNMEIDYSSNYRRVFCF